MTETLLRLSKFKNLFREAIVLPLSLTVMLSIIFFWQIQSLRSASQWVDHTDQIIAQANLTLRHLIDAETGLRGYFVKHDRLFLEPYHQAILDIPNDFSKTETLLSTNPEPRQAFAEAKQAATKWLNLAVEAELPEMAGRSSLETEPIIKGKMIMDQVRASFDTFISIEEKMRSFRVEEADRASRNTLFLGMALAILLGLTLAIRTRKSLVSLSEFYGKALSEVETRATQIFESRERFLTTLNSIGDAVVVVDTNAKISFLNPLAEKLTGWKLSDAEGQSMDNVFRIINEETKQPAFNPVDRVLTEGVVVGLANHTVLISKDGTEYPIEDSAAPLKIKVML
jgi:PAS domain S-box-containing protein